MLTFDELASGAPGHVCVVHALNAACAATTTSSNDAWRVPSFCMLKPTHSERHHKGTLWTCAPSMMHSSVPGGRHTWALGLKLASSLHVPVRQKAHATLGTDAAAATAAIARKRRRAGSTARVWHAAARGQRRATTRIAIHSASTSPKAAGLE